MPLGRPYRRSLSRNRFMIALLALGLCAGTASAQTDANWPTKPIRFVVPFPAGSFADIALRILQQKLGARLGQKLVIDNRSGASGNTGAELLAKAPPGGY